jgi:hypothetical protein
MEIGGSTLLTTLVALALAGATPGTEADSILHIGAIVRIQAPTVDSGWVQGTITRRRGR